MRRYLNNDSEQLISRSKVNCDSIIWSQIFNTFCSLKYEPRREKKTGAKLISAFVFAIRIVQISLLPKYEISSF